MKSPDRIVVLGSNSFSGASFASDAMKRGVEVIGISRSAEPHPALLPYRWGAHAAGFRFLQLDLNHQLDALDQLLRAERPSIIVNFAAQSMVAESWLTPAHWYQTNVVGLSNLVERLRHYDFLDRYVHVTTPEVYGNVQGVLTEDTPFNPSTPYAVSRAAGDFSLRIAFAQYGFPVVFTRAANVYGPGQALYRIIPRTIVLVKQGRRLQLQGGGTSQRSFIHIQDVADATWRIMMSGQSGDTYHIATPTLISIRSLVELIVARLGVAFDDAVEIVPDRPGKDAVYSLDSAKLRGTLDWADHISLDQGITECLEWVEHWWSSLIQLPSHYVHKP